MKTATIVVVLLIAAPIVHAKWPIIVCDPDLIGGGETYEYESVDVYFEMLTSDRSFIEQQGCDSDWMVVLSTAAPWEYDRRTMFVCGDPLGFHGGAEHWVGMHLYKDQFNGFKIIE